MFRRYDDKGKPIKKKVQIDCQAAIAAGEKHLVEQSHKDEVDINNIVRKYNADMISKINQMTEWRFDDVTTNDFQEMMNQMIKARDTFGQIPKEIRHRFKNDPAAFMDFCMNPENKQELIDLGLANPPEVVEPVQVAVVSSPETPPQDTA